MVNDGDPVRSFLAQGRLEPLEVDGGPDTEIVIERLGILEPGQRLPDAPAVKAVVHDQHSAPSERGERGVDGERPGAVHQAQFEVRGSEVEGGEEPGADAGREPLELGLAMAELDVEQVL